MCAEGFGVKVEGFGVWGLVVQSLGLRLRVRIWSLGFDVLDVDSSLTKPEAFFVLSGVVLKLSRFAQITGTKRP